MLQLGSAMRFSVSHQVFANQKIQFTDKQRAFGHLSDSLFAFIHPSFFPLPAGLTCLKDVAAAIPRAFFNSLTSCQAFRASQRLMKPGDPFTTDRRQ